MSDNDTNKIIEIILIIFLPPLAIWVHDKQCSGHVCLNIILLFFFALPAVIHAVWYCFIRDANRSNNRKY
uniref:Uncharacterized protein n=1 Tax=Plectus sambesii TaxID=2011161 RepID=A0A914VMN5_9BILA